MTPEQNAELAGLSLWCSGFLGGMAFSALIAVILIKIGFWIRREPPANNGAGQ